MGGFTIAKDRTDKIKHIKTKIITIIISRKTWVFITATVLVIYKIITPEIWGFVAAFFMGTTAADKYIANKGGQK